MTRSSRNDSIIIIIFFLNKDKNEHFYHFGLMKVGQGVMLLAVQLGTVCWQQQSRKMSWMVDF